MPKPDIVSYDSARLGVKEPARDKAAELLESGHHGCLREAAELC